MGERKSDFIVVVLAPLLVDCAHWDFADLASNDRVKVYAISLELRDIYAILVIYSVAAIPVSNVAPVHASRALKSSRYGYDDRDGTSGSKRSTGKQHSFLGSIPCFCTVSSGMEWVDFVSNALRCQVVCQPFAART